MDSYLSIALCIYLLLIVGLAFFVSGKTESDEDFLVGGRSFSLWLTTFCLFATWFGAGTLITATDQVAREGLYATALEPYGAGFCLIFAGLFFAKPLWEMKLMTYSDFFRLKFGIKVEMFSVLLNVPIYVGWIAVQIVSLANILAVFFPLPVWVFFVIITLFTAMLTVSGGMWSVSLTDSFQLVIIMIGLIYLVFKVSGAYPEGLSELIGTIPSNKLSLIPTEKLQSTLKWFGVFSISALGNITGQDLGQRMFSAKNAKTAKLGCYLAGIGYLLFGSIPVLFGLTAHTTLGQFEGSVIPNLISRFLDPISGVILTLTIISAIVSTITSALLAPSSMLANNFLKNYFKEKSTLALCKVSVILVAICSLLTAFLGESVYGLLEDSYALGFVSFFAPLTIGLFSNKLNENACLLTIFLSTLIWLPNFFEFSDLPLSLYAVIAAYPIYFLSYRYFHVES